MISAKPTTEVGRFPEFEAVFEADGGSPGRVTVNRYGGFVVTQPGQYERLAQTDVFDLALAASE